MKTPDTESILAGGSLLLFSIVTISVLFNIVPAENEKYAMLMLGALIGINKDTFGRYFQATKGAQEQRKEAAEVAKTLAETAATVAVAASAPASVASGDVTLKPGESVEVAAAPAPVPADDPTMFGGPRP